MTTLTLLRRISNDFQLKQVGKVLRLSLQGLEVEAKILGTVADGWVQVVLGGEDESAATNFLIKEIGVCPSSFGSVRKFSMLKGYIRNIQDDAKELSVDVGVFQPKNVYASLGLRRLQAQLVDGKEIALSKIAELFGLCEGLPVSVKVTGLNEEESRIDAELSSKQIGRYVAWRESLLDRLLVLGSSLREVELALQHAKLKRDVIDVETLGLLEHALTCKLGTDAAGLIPKIGRNLKNSKFVVFNPKALRAFLKAEN
jgi:hypothetical protein